MVHFSKLSRGKPTRHSLVTKYQFRGKPRGIIPFGGANKKPLLILFSLLFGVTILYSCAEKKEIDKSKFAVSVGLVESSQGEIWIKKQDSTLHIITTPESSNGIFETANLSPNKQFILLTVPLGDFGEAWIYNLAEDKFHAIDGGFGVGEIKWLKNNKVMLHQGCILATHCKKLESINSTTPWLLKVTKDLSEVK